MLRRAAPARLDAGDLDCGHVPGVVVEHGQPLTDVFDCFALVFVLGQQAGRRPLLASEDERGQLRAQPARRAELDGSKAADDRVWHWPIKSGSLVGEEGLEPSTGAV